MYIWTHILVLKEVANMVSQPEDTGLHTCNVPRGLKGEITKVVKFKGCVTHSQVTSY